jgi:chromosomal replication initiator protein
MDAWNRILSLIRARVSPQCLDTWFRPVSFLGIEGDLLRLSVPSENFGRWLLDHYRGVILEAAREATHRTLRIDLTCPAPVGLEPAPQPAAAPASDDTGFPLNPRYTFDSFVVGSSNQFARAAAIAVAEQPSRAYNPLYVYGGVGLGKTHLLHAIGHFIHQKSPRLCLSYMPSEHFMNELVNSIRYDRTTQFRQKYRNIDVLLMDDVQFFAGKERTQEEFFHTFNALYDAQKQIVITSDCPPKDIPTIEERLHSRFEWGLIADIQSPDLETRIAILKKKAASVGITFSDEVTGFVATCIRSSIRELEGALLRLSAKASLDGFPPCQIDPDYAREALKDIVVDDRRAITTEMVIRAVSNHFGLKPAQLKSRNNARPISEPRQIAMYISKQLTGQSLPQIGKDFGGKHHTTVLHSIRKIERLKKSDRGISEAVSKILKNVN